MVVLGGLGAGVNAALNYQQNKAQPAFQREGTVAVETQKPAEESSEKLKSAATKAREDEQLAKQVKSKLKNVPGGQKWSVYVRDLNSDRMASINADSEVNAAGLSNLFLVAPLEAKMPSNKWTYKAGKQTIGGCVEQMIKANDANCIQTLKQYTNMKSADDVNKSLGFKKTTISGKDTETTAREAGDLLYRLQTGQVLSDKARRTVFDGLYTQKSREGIPAGCDQKCLVANITGEANGVRSDAAIVTTGSSKYVVVIVANGASWSQIADVAASIRLTMQP